MDKNNANRYSPLAVDPGGSDVADTMAGGRASRASNRRSASLNGSSTRQSLQDLADAALNERAGQALDELRRIVNASPDQRGRIRKHDEFAPDGTPVADRTARAERWVRAHNSMSSMDGHNAAADTPTPFPGLNANSDPVKTHPRDSQEQRVSLEQAPRPERGSLDATPGAELPANAGLLEGQTPQHMPMSTFAPASSLLRPRTDEKGMTILWPTPAESVRSVPQIPRPTSKTISSATQRPRTQQKSGTATARAPPKGSERAFKIPPPPPSHRPRAHQRTVPSFDVDAGVWQPYTHALPTRSVDSLGATSMDISPPRSLVAGLRSIKTEEDDTDSWLRTSAGRGGGEYSPPPSPTSDVLGMRQERRRHQSDPLRPLHAHNDAGDRAERGRKDQPAMAAPTTGGADSLAAPVDGAGSHAHDGLTDDEDDMYVEDDAAAMHLPGASDDDADLDAQDADDECIATDEDRVVAGAIDPVFEQTRVPMRAAARTRDGIDGATAGSLWAGVDPSTLNQWAKLATGNFGVRVHSVDGDTNIHGMNSVQLRLDLQNTIRCTEPGSEALLAPGRSVPGSPPAAPGLFLVHNVSLQSALAWTSHQFLQVGRYYLVVFLRDHEDSTFVGTWAESTMPCLDLESGLRDRCKSAQHVRAVFKEVEAEHKGQGSKAFRRFLASISVRPLVIKPRGSRGVEVTEYNVYTGRIAYDVKRTDGSTVETLLSTERRLRLHDAMLEISVPDAFHGAAVRRSTELRQYDCAICKSKSHPRGKCPALDIPNWGRPLRRATDRRFRQRAGTTTSRRSPPPQLAPGSAPPKNHRAGANPRGRPGKSG